MYSDLLYLHIRFQISNIHTFLTFPNVSHSMHFLVLFGGVILRAWQLPYFGTQFKAIASGRHQAGETRSWTQSKIAMSCLLKVATVTFAIYYVFKNSLPSKVRSVESSEILIPAVKQRYFRTQTV